MTITTDASATLFRASDQGSDSNQRHFAREQDNGPSAGQDTVTLSGEIIARLSADSNSEQRIATLKQQYENGTYQPSWQELAGRILDIHL